MAFHARARALACALVLGRGFVVRLLTAAEPLIPIAILADPAARLAIAAHSFGWGSIIGLNIFLPMYLQSALGWSATSSGLSLMVLMVMLNASAGLSSQLVGRVKPYKLLPLCCLCSVSVRFSRWLFGRHESRCTSRSFCS